MTAAASGGRHHRRASGFFGISPRLMAFNGLLVFLPLAGLLSFDLFERYLRTAQERTMVQEARVFAATLAIRQEPLGDVSRDIILALAQRHDARLRVVDATGRLVADSAQLGPRREQPAPEREAESATEPWLYRLAAYPFRLWTRLTGDEHGTTAAPPDSNEVQGFLFGSEVRAALDGRYGAATRIVPGSGVVMSSAVPVMRDGRVAGAVVVSQSTTRLLNDLDRIRLGVFRIFLYSLAASIALTLLAATTIVRPLRRLRAEAEAIADRRGRLVGRFRGSGRRDEIGDLSRSLEDLSRRLEEHLHFTESFARDLGHELRNPLASIRTAAELARAEDADRRRFLEMIGRDVARIERLLASASELARIDAELDREPRQPIDLRSLVAPLVEGWSLRTGAPRFELQLPDEPLVAAAVPDRLTQAIENLLDNAVGFSPPDGVVRVELDRDGDRAALRVIDQGPGFPPEHLARAFDRFFTYRPGNGTAATHTGLGLALVRSIAEAHGGQVRAANAEGGGAIVELRLPLVEG